MRISRHEQLIDLLLDRPHATWELAHKLGVRQQSVYSIVTRARRWLEARTRRVRFRDDDDLYAKTVESDPLDQSYRLVVDWTFARPRQRRLAL